MVVKFASKVICNSSKTAYEVSKNLKVPDQKIEVIKLGIKRDKFIPYNFKRDNFLLIIARHIPHKNIPRVLKAFYIFRNLSRSFSD